MKTKLPILFGIIACLLTGGISRLFHEPAMSTWYPLLEQSSLTPPNIVFPIVWGILYVLMGISVGLLYGMKIFPTKNILLWLFAIQLVLNVGWNYVFFYLQNPMLGFDCLIVLDLLAAVFFMGTVKVKRSVAFFFLPYLLWLLFATYLNFYIYLNY